MQNLEHRLFNKTKLLLVMLIMSCTTVMAQTFTDHVRKDGNGKATVTITQSADVEKLVNSRPALTEKQKIAEQQAEAARAAKEAKENKEREKAREAISNRPQHSGGTHASTSTNNDADDNDMNIPTVDMRKKMIRNGYKVTGYRVQAFAGRNSKADRIKAESVGNAINEIPRPACIRTLLFSKMDLSCGQLSHIRRGCKDAEARERYGVFGSNNCKRTDNS